jgi:outer membrane protein TolC
MLKKIVLAITAMLLAAPVFGSAAEVGVEEFLTLAGENDSRFEMLLADEMAAKYKKGLIAKTGDIILGAKSGYVFNLPGIKQGSRSSSVSLSKLFPAIGLLTGAEYSVASAMGGGADSSIFTAEVLLPLVKNAFGFADRMTDEIAGCEEGIAKLQVAEAYEEYTAFLLKLYYTWYSDYSALLAAEASLKESEKLYANMQERKKSGIAYSVDVNKTKVQVLDKRANYLELKQKYAATYNYVKATTGLTAESIPVHPPLYRQVEPSDAAAVYEASRAAALVELVVKKSRASEARAFNYLLPSVNVSGGYTTQGEGFALSSNASSLYAGVSVELPLFAGERESADYNTQKAAAKKAAAQKIYDRAQYAAAIGNLNLMIQKQGETLAIAREKEAAALEILSEEKKNYSQARISLNDLINALNSYEQAKYGAITAEIQLNLYAVEWCRLADCLVMQAQGNDDKEK